MVLDDRIRTSLADACVCVCECVEWKLVECDVSAVRAVLCVATAGKRFLV